VFDTNVYISAFLYGGKPKQVLEFAMAGRVQLLISIPLKLELQRVLRDKFDLAPGEIASDTEAIWKRAEWISPRRRLSLCRDESDNRLLECAVEGRADVVVTGDRDLLDLPAIEGLAILTPAAFLSRANAEEPLA
jgi:putative PIN family toxin of toxin-antitoxin system